MTSTSGKGYAYYQRDAERQIPYKEENLSCKNVQKDLYKDIDWENSRVNVDSSKKIACMQHMDYDGFHQMVLGANLKPMKKGQMERMFDPRGGCEGNINPIASFDIKN